MAKTLSKIHQRVQEASVKRAQAQSNASVQRKLNQIVEAGLSVGKDSDQDLLDTMNQTWDDLDALRMELANAVMTFTGQTYGMIHNPHIQNLLGDRRPEFDQLAKTFDADIKGFSQRIKDLRLQHEGRTGRVTSMEDYATFNRLMISYTNANEELMALLGPTMTGMVLITNECTQAAVQAQQAADLANPAVVSDVEVKV